MRPTRVPFVKMHGLGNDFVVFDGVRRRLELDAGRVRAIADRHFGIGCDQVLLVEPATKPGAHFSYRIFNADGGEVAQCGNGARCFARFVREQGLCDADDVIVDTRAGRMVLHLQPNGDVKVNMGVPRHAPEEIPYRAVAEAPLYRLTIDGTEIGFGAVSLGNPHAVIVVDDVDLAPVATLGRRIESDPAFPERVNVGFLAPVDRQQGRLRVFERGSGETLACGSGACAAVIVGIEQGLFDDTVHLDLPGGRLQVQWSGRGHPAFLIGPAVTVFEGSIDL
ncbi:diaminopimelate epimerase [Methylolobus aquaticus]